MLDIPGDPPGSEAAAAAFPISMESGGAGGDADVPDVGPEF